MRKFFNILIDYLLPIIMAVSALIVFVRTDHHNLNSYLGLITGISFGSLLVYQSIKEKERKKAYLVNGKVSVSDSKDNGNLPETLPQKPLNFLDGELASNINRLTKICYNASYAGGWHTDRFTGKLLDRNKAEMLCLIHSEISEAMEGERKGLMDDHLPERPMPEVELADAVIRIADYCERWGYDLGGAIVEKLAYNATRADHKPENRSKEGGKKF